MRTIILIGCILLSLVGSSVAQEKPSEKPAARPAKSPVKTMIDYRDELGLTDEQVETVKTALTNYAEALRTQRAALKDYEKEYSELVKSEAPLADIKSKLRQIADTRFNLRYADVLTSRRVTEALSSEQMTKWREIQVKVRTENSSK